MNFNKDKKIALKVLIGLLIFNILAWFVVYDLNKKCFLEVTFFDVGQGDAFFIETPSKHQILIDGGSTSLILEKLGKEMSFWDRTIDLVVLSHPESDHLAGLLDVLRSYKVENILWTGAVRDTGVFIKWQELIEKEKAEIFIAKAGQKVIAGKTSFEVLFPFENLEGKPIKNSNNTSIVLRFEFGEISFLFTGDIEKSAEKELVETGVGINSQVLKVGHHGSKTSTAEDFIKKVLPEIAVISSGRNNSYGHPHPETLDVLGKYGIKILRTDLNGDIKVISDGNNFKIKNHEISTF